MGRHSDYTPEIATEICALIAEGKSVRAICREEGMPSMRSVLRWLDAREEFRRQYARAREIQADTLADEILDIADTTQEGEKVKITDKGEEITRGDMIEHRRLQVDTRKWVAAKLLPKKYGERQQLEHSGTLTLAQLIQDAAGDGNAVVG